ncbi:MAG: toll/interleukin-1 receptor domain-containing protein [Mesorhizobium sp.]|nr:hypothetical protein [Mesorhizobium sp.]MCO5162108.1 toll/interleukin-1 receptor domain-containing protein [Mesorhizobium sp.]
MAHIFISHASDDKRNLMPFLDSLLKLDATIWIDSEVAVDPKYLGKPNIISLHNRSMWSTEIDRAVLNADAVFIFWSIVASKRPSTSIFWREIEAARELNKDFHFLIEKDVKLPPLIATRQLTHLYPGPGIDRNRFFEEKNIDKIFDNIFSNNPHFISLLTTRRSANSTHLSLVSQQPSYIETQNTLLNKIYEEQYASLPAAFPKPISKDCLVLNFPAERSFDQEFRQDLFFPNASLRERLPPRFPKIEEMPVPLIEQASIFPVLSTLSPQQKDYFEQLTYSRRVRRPNMLGFSMGSLTLNRDFRIRSFDANLCNYMENALSNHILQHSLIEKFVGDPVGLQRDSSKTALTWPALQLESKSDGCYQLELRSRSATELYPLISVQAIVVFKRERHWHFISAARTQNAAVAQGRLQLQPAGGFEIYGRETDDWDKLVGQFRLEDALIREFLEECAGDADLTAANEDVSKGQMTESEGYHRVRRMMEQENRFHIHFLGVVLDLVLLRPEFSFVIVIEGDDRIDLTYELRSASSSVKSTQWLTHDNNEALKLTPIPLKDLSEWMNNPKAHSSSIGLAKLFIEAISTPGNFFSRRYMM